ncbi:CUP9 [Candida margitis]|uniref:CUP9 n=1 Tax=Candida margitis TaxID=1775924 RepID=UPI00222607F8|nr:CUP9 [Candida margitis]KAI5970749.1 CUP9 [Candida margitis]
MQLTELIHHSRSSTLPSISATNSYEKNTLPLPSYNSTARQEQLHSQSHSKEAVPQVAKRISLPPISDLLSTPPSQQQLPSVVHLQQQSQPQQQQQHYQNGSQSHYNYYTATSTTANNNNEYLNRSPNPGYNSTSSSISSPSSVQYQNQQSHYFHNLPQQQQQLPSIIRSNSYPQSSLNQEPNYRQHYTSTHEYHPRHQHSNNHSHYTTTSNSSSTTNPTDSNGNSSKRKTRNNLPKEITYVLLRWLNDHLNHPYPNSFEKNQLMMATGLNQQQLSNWFINARRRKIKTLKEQKRMMHLI